MRLKKLFIVVLVLTFATVCFAQSTIGFSASATAGVGRHASVAESRPLISAVATIEVRHCAKYASVVDGRTVVDAAACAADLTTLDQTLDDASIVPDAGFDFITKALSDTATQPASCNYVAVSNNAITPAAGDTTLAGELAVNGFTRGVAPRETFAHTTGTKTYTVTKVFTATGTQQTQATGLFNATSTGTMCYEATYTAVTVNNTDTLTVTWTITLS